MLNMAVGNDENRYYARLGLALRELRSEAKVSAEDAAKRAGVNIESIWRWERGTPAIRAYQLAPLAELYGLSRDAYYHLVDPEDRVNPWRGRLGAARTDALEWERSQRSESPESPADQGSEHRRSGRTASR